MTTAYNFPDLDISPIDDVSVSIQRLYPQLSVDLKTFSCKLTVQDLEITPFSDIFPREEEQVRAEDQNEDIEVVEATVSLDLLPESGQVATTDDESDTDNYSSEDVFQRLEKDVKEAIYQVSSEEDELSGSCMSNSILRGICVFVDFQCCTESAKTVKSKLRQMGALVLRRMTPVATHVVFARGGKKNTLQFVLSIQNKPFLVDPHWVHACYFSQCRVPEQNYNLYEGKFLVDSIKRLSTAGQEEAVLIESFQQIELTPEDDLEPRRRQNSGHISESEELTFDAPMSATQLLAKIDKLSKKLDKIEAREDIASLSHGDRCPSRQSLSERRDENGVRSTGTNTVQLTKPVYRPLRRRSHGAFGLAHRLPFSTAVQQLTVNREQESAENGLRDLTNRVSAAGREGRAVDGIDDMRKTLPQDLKQIHRTLQNNSKYRRKKERPSQKASQRVRMPVISETLDSSAPVLRTPRRVTAPRQPVSTASAMINRLQTVPSSDEFADRKESRLQKRGVVFTGFSRDEETILRAAAGILNLKVQRGLDNFTRGVVSCKGHRTLATLRALVLGIPVVTAEWLSASEREDRLVSLRRFVYPKWQKALETNKSTLFLRLGEILVIEACSPPTEDLKWLIKKCGGKIARCANDCELIVSPEGEVVQVPWTRTNRPPPAVVPERFILDCISEARLLNIGDYSDVSVSIVDQDDE